MQSLNTVDIVSLVGYAAAGGLTASIEAAGAAIDAAYPGHNIGRQVMLWTAVGVALATVVYRIIQRPTPTNSVSVIDQVTGKLTEVRTVAAPGEPPSAGVSAKP